MRSEMRAVVAAVSLAALVAVCGPTASAAGATPADGALPRGSEPAGLDPSTFSADIDNRYWPMEPRTRWIYREIDEAGSSVEVVVTVTTRTKRIANGIVARVVRDTVSSGDRVIEDTVDWYAQDADGNVWYLGENTAELERGKVTSREGSWEAGVDGALPGIAVPSRPAVGMTYRQEYYAGHAEDNGEVLGIEEQAEVPAGHFEHVVLTKDTNALEPQVLEYKLYAPDVGPVLAIGISGGGGREELVVMKRVGSQEARRAGVAALGANY